MEVSDFIKVMERITGVDIPRDTLYKIELLLALGGVSLYIEHMPDGGTILDACAESYTLNGGNQKALFEWICIAFSVPPERVFMLSIEGYSVATDVTAQFFMRPICADLEYAFERYTRDSKVIIEKETA